MTSGLTSTDPSMNPLPACQLDSVLNPAACTIFIGMFVFISISIVFIDRVECITEEVARTYFSFYLQIRHFSWQKQERGNFTTVVWCSSFCLVFFGPHLAETLRGLMYMWIVSFHSAWPFVATEAKMLTQWRNRDGHGQWSAVYSDVKHRYIPSPLRAFCPQVFSLDPNWRPPRGLQGLLTLQLPAFNLIFL